MNEQIVNTSFPESKQMRFEVSAIDREGFAKLRSLEEEPMPSCMKGVRMAPLLVGEQVQATFVRQVHPRNNNGEGKKRLFLHSWQRTKDASERIPSQCPHFGSCGGCRLQHIPYSSQAKQKENWVRGLFSTFSIVPEPILEPQQVWHYREKMQLTFNQDRHGTQRIGLYGLVAKRKVIDLERCDLFDPHFSVLLASVRRWWAIHPVEAYNAAHHRGDLRTITVRRGKSTEGKATWILMLTLSNPISEETEPAIRAWEEAMHLFAAEVNVEVGLYTQIHFAEKGKRTTFTLEHRSGPKTTTATLQLGTTEKKEVTFAIGPTSFFQPNPQQAQAIFDLLGSWMEPLKIQRCLDLYCGTGTLTLVAALSGVRDAVGVEVNAEAVEIAKQVATSAKISNVTFYAEEVGTFLKKSKDTFDCLILDPPRAGMGEQASKSAVTIGAAHIFYLSCNPKTQVEDLKFFVDAGYSIEKVRSIDQFPHTLHVENLVYLKKQSLSV